MIKLKGSFESARFEAELVPHRSMSPDGVKMVLAVSALTTLPPAIGFGMAGFWPISLALLLAQGGLHMGFRASARAAEERQFLVMNDNGLTLTHTRPDWEGPVITQIHVPPQARIEEQDNHGSGRLSLCLHNKKIPLGRFLPPAEAKKLQTSLKLALRNWTKDPAPSI